MCMLIKLSEIGIISHSHRHSKMFIKLKILLLNTYEIFSENILNI